MNAPDAPWRTLAEDRRLTASNARRRLYRAPLMRRLLYALRIAIGRCPYGTA